jgi:hypothetical protein
VFLRLHEDTTLELQPEEAGEYPFTCGMQMTQGTLRNRSCLRGPAGIDHHALTTRVSVMVTVEGDFFYADPQPGELDRDRLAWELSR